MNKAVCFITLLLLTAPAYAEDERIDALVTFSATGEKTPLGGIGVYTKEYSRRIGTIETLADGSTVLRGDYGRIIAKVPLRRLASQPVRIEVSPR